MAGDQERWVNEWRTSGETFLPLPAAAAIVYRESQGATASSPSRADHDDALNIAASALSRLVAIYAYDARAHERVVVKLDLLQGRFARGATEFRRRDGEPLAELWVRRADLGAALALIEQAGIPFSFALSPARSDGKERQGE